MSYTINQRGNIALRVYEDSRPHHHKSKSIQKGLIFVYDGKEVCGEGIGFGAPVVRYSDKTYFPTYAAVSVSEANDCISIKKSFEINSVFRLKVFGKSISSRHFYWVTEFFSKLHRENRAIRKILDVFLKLIRKFMGKPSELVKTASKGLIIVDYQIRADDILISIDNSKIDKNNCIEICIMNEQGADFFRKYTDTSGNLWIDDQIDSWGKVNAREARFSDLEDRVSFGLEKIAGAELYRGRETFKGHLSWTGFAYCIPANCDYFQYRLKIWENIENG